MGSTRQGRCWCWCGSVRGTSGPVRHAPWERTAWPSRTPGGETPPEVGLAQAGIGRLERDWQHGTRCPGQASSAGLGGQTAGVGLPGPHAHQVRRPAVGQARRRWTLMMMTMTAWASARGAKIPSSARCRPLPCWSPATCDAEPRAGPNRPVGRGVSGHDRWVSTPQKPNPADRAVRATRPVFMQVIGLCCDSHRCHRLAALPDQVRQRSLSPDARGGDHEACLWVGRPPNCRG